MYNGKTILAIIPARGGSKGLPGKNIRLLSGKPLLAWAIDVLKECNIVDQIFISTDSENIASVATQYGVEVPFLRNQFIAKDNSLVIDAVLEALNYFSKVGKNYDIIMLIEPTSPLRTASMIVDCIEKMVNTNAQSIATFSELEVPLERIWCINENNAYTYLQNNLAFRPRQSLSKVYKLNGLLYAINVEALIKMSIPQIMTMDVLPYITPREMSTDIDDINDFEYIDYLVRNKNGK